MSTAGWYPDPDGTSGRYRYWDGQSWSATTTTDPRTDPPAAGVPRRASGMAAVGSTAEPSRAIDPGYQPARAAAAPPRRGRRILVIGAALLLLIIVAASGLLVWRGPDLGLTGPNPPAASVWDDSSPTAAPTPRPTPVPTTLASRRPSTPNPSEGRLRCPEGSPTRGPAKPADRRVHGGRLSYAMIAGYAAPQPRPRLSWFYDTASQFQVTEPGWASSFTVGEVQRAGMFGQQQQAAEHTLQCMITGDGFDHFASRKDLQSKAITVDGRPAWMIMTEIRVDRTDLSIEGDRVAVIFVDDGRRDRLSGFVGLVPIGDSKRIALMDTVIKGLRVH
ncbi:DUF2510 domain-containing protein [Microlunatus sp. GCM10028923]|uniref:DUF2510 domain-containing protein n=1 Tax=Microlunatus sp. GCM10028923 TaxID=3273400 RepID=UPI003605F6E0